MRTPGDGPDDGTPDDGTPNDGTPDDGTPERTPERTSERRVLKEHLRLRTFSSTTPSNGLPDPYEISTRVARVGHTRIVFGMDDAATHGASTYV